MTVNMLAEHIHQHLNRLFYADTLPETADRPSNDIANDMEKN